MQFLDIMDYATYKSASALPGGVAVCGEGSCGALSGAAMSVSLVYGRASLQKSAESLEAQEAHCRLFRLTDEFAKEFGGYTCHAVQKTVLGQALDMRDPAKVQERLALRPMILEKSSVIISKATELAIEAIFEDTENLSRFAPRWELFKDLEKEQW